MVQEQKVFKRLRRFRRLRNVYGVFVVVVAWAISNSVYFPPIHKVLYPDYYAALKGRAALVQNKQVDRWDDGFENIVGVLETKFNVKGITAINLVKVIPITYPNDVMAQEVAIEVVYGDSKKFKINIDLDSSLRSAYLSEDYFLYSFLVFVVGAVILLYPVFKVRKRDKIEE